MVMDKKVILYIILGIVVLLLVFFTAFPKMVYAVKDSGITGNSIGSGNDICSPPVGSSYTEQEWKIHMSHHPNIYKDCLI